MGAGDEVGGGEGDGDEVGEVRDEQGGERVVEVGARVLRAAEGALGQDARAELQVQQAGLEVDELGPQRLVRGGRGAQRGEAVEEHVRRDLQPALRPREHVLGRELGDRGAQEEDERRRGEHDERAEGLRRYGSDGHAGGAGGGADRAVVAYGLGQEDGAEE